MKLLLVNGAQITKDEILDSKLDSRFELDAALFLGSGSAVTLERREKLDVFRNAIENYHGLGSPYLADFIRENKIDYEVFHFLWKSYAHSKAKDFNVLCRNLFSREKRRNLFEVESIFMSVFDYMVSSAKRLMIVGELSGVPEIFGFRQMLYESEDFADYFSTRKMAVAKYPEVLKIENFNLMVIPAASLLNPNIAFGAPKENLIIIVSELTKEISGADDISRISQRLWKVDQDLFPICVITTGEVLGFESDIVVPKDGILKIG